LSEWKNRVEIRDIYSDKARRDRVCELHASKVVVPKTTSEVDAGGRDKDHEIAKAVSARHPDRTVCYITTEESQ
jgi:hypothetical protein